jgi:hypothetical protein
MESSSNGESIFAQKETYASFSEFVIRIMHENVPVFI